MEFPVITALAGGIVIILQMAMSFYVVMARAKYKVSVGDNGEVELERRVRAHGNLAENAAIIIVILALLELARVSPLVVGVFAVWFVIARIAHAIGMIEKSGRALKAINKARFFGAASTMLLGMIMGGMLIFIALSKV
jgi:uncharacterized membrane protein YecN with MAPEG domain